ncbi:MAG: hypothetical protein ACRDY2_13285 [Acidimicrobiales bacterium]
MSFENTEADFTQPYYYTCPQPATGLNWAGLGGLNGAALLQSGTLQFHSNPNGAVAYDFAQVWAVNAKSYTYGPDGPPATVGHSIEGFVVWNYHGGTTGAAELLVYDLTNNSSWGVTYTLPRAQYGPGVAGFGATAEAISEKSPSALDALDPSSNQVQFTYFTAAQYQTGTYYTFSAMPFMVWENSFLSSNAASRTGLTFQSEWNHC